MALTCNKCGATVKQIGPFNRPHQCKITRSVNPVAALVETAAESYGVGPDWAPSIYGEYYAKSPMIYSAIRIRAHALSRPALRVYRDDKNGRPQEVELKHPLNQILSKVNPYWTERDLRYGTSVHLDLWGSAFWVLRRNSPSAKPTEIWLYRPDKMRIIGDSQKYIKAFIYRGETRQDEYLDPQDVVWFRNFNPMAEFAGLSPMAPVRLSADTASDGMVHNRNVFKNGILSDTGIIVEDLVTDQQVADLLRTIRKKYSNPENSHVPIVLGGVKDIKSLGLTNRDMEFLATLRWSLEDVARVFGVPKILLQDLERSTYENVNAAERLFWRNTVVPELQFLEARMNEMLVPNFKDEQLYISYDLHDIEALQDNLNDIASRQQMDVVRGILTINEARAERRLDPVPWGDTFWATWGLYAVADQNGMPLLAGPGQSAEREKVKAYNFEVFGKAYSERISMYVDRFARMQGDLFSRQMVDIFHNLRLGSNLFVPEEWTDLFYKRGKVVLTEALVDSARSQIASFGLGVNFNPSDSAIHTWIDGQLATWAERVNAETLRLVTAEVQDAGADKGTIQARIEKVFSFNETVRASRIARTEIQSAANFGALASYKESNMVEAKMWLSTLDSDVRPAHAAAHGQTVPVDSAFIVGGESLMYPGDLSGSPDNVTNCQCIMAPVIGKTPGRLKSSPKIPPELSYSVTQNIENQLAVHKTNGVK